MNIQPTERCSQLLKKKKTLGCKNHFKKKQKYKDECYKSPLSLKTSLPVRIITVLQIKNPQSDHLYGQKFGLKGDSFYVFFYRNMS